MPGSDGIRSRFGFSLEELMFVWAIYSQTAWWCVRKGCEKDSGKFNLGHIKLISMLNLDLLSDSVLYGSSDCIILIWYSSEISFFEEDAANSSTLISFYFIIFWTLSARNKYWKQRNENCNYFQAQTCVSIDSLVHKLCRNVKIFNAVFHDWIGLLALSWKEDSNICLKY